MIVKDSLILKPLSGIPLVQPGDDVAGLILRSLCEAGTTLASGDVLVVTSKIVSKAEGRWLDIRTVSPGEQARELAEATGKDPRLVEVILQQSVALSRYRQGVLIVRHRLGFTSANAGVDHSNVGPDGDNWVLLLPEDPDNSAKKLRDDLRERAGVEVGIVLSDTHGRPFRSGNVGVAIGVAGIPAILDLRGQADLFGRELQATVIAVADAIASAAGLVSGEADEGRPVVLLRGLSFPAGNGRAADLNRDPEFDLYK